MRKNEDVTIKIEEVAELFEDLPEETQDSLIALCEDLLSY